MRTLPHALSWMPHAACRVPHRCHFHFYCHFWPLKQFRSHSRTISIAHTPTDDFTIKHTCVLIYTIYNHIHMYNRTRLESEDGYFVMYQRSFHFYFWSNSDAVLRCAHSIANTINIFNKHFSISILWLSIRLSHLAPAALLNTLGPCCCCVYWLAVKCGFLRFPAFSSFLCVICHYCSTLNSDTPQSFTSRRYWAL